MPDRGSACLRFYASHLGMSVEERRENIASHYVGSHEARG